MNSISSVNSTSENKPSILVLGVGNPILTDDGVGIHIVRELQKKFSHIPNLEFDEMSTGGLSLAERFIDYQRVIMIDAFALQGGIPGDVYKFSMENLETTIHTYCAHDCNLATAVDILKQELGPERMPKEVVIIGIEVETINEFSETLTKTVQKAVPKAFAMAEEEIMKALNQIKS
ncbi:MAG: hydrogenase maturation protease [Candidatus Heimdallarchaeota archaeon]|nr:hydrogenase maturation protease [Candidatus Heimdallarchaeota archaeon]